jgi:hypothetical protein
VVATVAGDTGVGGDLETLKNTVKGITDESDALKDKVKNDVIPTLKDEFNAVNDLLSKYGEQRTTLL